MKKFILCNLVLLITQGLFSQEVTTIPKKKTQESFFSADFLSVDMPTNDLGLDEDHMGLTGIHYNLKFKNFYTGLGMYGVIRGKRGGFFTLGINAGYQSYLSEKLFLDTGIHFGGGGGAGAPDGGGAFILPHLNLGYTFRKMSLTAGYSYINFFDGGNIIGHQLNVGLQFPLTIDLASIEDAEKGFKIDDFTSSEWNKKAKRMSFMLHLNNLSVKGSSRDTKGNSLNGSTIRLAGFELNSYLNEKWFFFAKFDGAYDGIPAGYMNIFLGGGHHFSFNKNRTNILAKFGLGAGGGGGVDSQGGVLIYPDISLEQHITNNVYLSINKGFLMSPNSFFETSTFGVGLKYYSDINGTSGAEFSMAKFKGFEVIVKQDVYHNAERTLNPTENLYQIALQLNYHLNKNIYVAGQTAFANFGNAGAYAEGIVGLGFQTNSFFNKKINLFAQGLIGGAGGGDISTGEGLIFKPSAGMNYSINSSFALRGALGYVKARGGSLSSPMINFGVSYRLAFLSAK
ncbi:hypothetical protein AAON49_03500 [Pseudotenacibaculum sp. MALMAid0570]|uniref:hypothetical protein n=1 Tax=Pseudotenacibaculum sp. MALMAid0570 TaxID=3143938 RepID=UPI0032DFE323